MQRICDQIERRVVAVNESGLVTPMRARESIVAVTGVDEQKAELIKSIRAGGTQFIYDPVADELEDWYSQYRRTGEVTLTGPPT